MEKQIKNFIAEKIKERGLSLNKVSQAIGKDGTYLFQFINRNSPKRLGEIERKKLAQILNVDEQELTDLPPNTKAYLDYQSNIKKRRLELGMSQATLGEKVGLSQQHIQRIENGYDISTDKIQAFAEALQISARDLLPENFKKIVENIDIPSPNTVSIDILDVSACCGDGIENFTENVIGQQMMTLPALREFTTAAPENIKIIKAIGDSMLPTICPGDVVWVDISCRSPESDGLYLLCVGKNLMIKRIQINPFTNSATIKSDNPQYESFQQANFTDVNVMGRVIYHMKKY